MAIFIPEEKVAEIKQAADIVDVVSESVQLRKTGRNFVGLCPFHSEKTPSFTVSPEKQIYYCFGCGAGGNIFSFLMKKEGLTFPEAAKRLAHRFGIDMPVVPLSAAQRAKIDEKEQLQKINAQAMQLFQETLHSRQTGQHAKKYLETRGFSPQILRQFRVGYAPQSWDFLVKHFSGQRMPLRSAEKAGLIAKRKKSAGYYDRFRGRVIFPILDVNGSCCGFGGRVLDDSQPKYLNSPETPIYNKRRMLYGLQRAKESCRDSGSVFIVEGYLDLLALHQNGIENSVATLGTSLTSEHIRLLSRYANRIILVYDSDEAGIRSAQRCIQILWQEHVDFRRNDVFREEQADTHILVLPAGHDPDSYLSAYGPASFKEEAARAKGIISFLIDRTVEKHGLTTEGKIKIISELQRPLANINDQVARSLYVKQLAERIAVAEDVVLEKIRKLQAIPATAAKPSDAAATASGGAGSDSDNRFEQLIIAMMLQVPAIIPEIEQRDVLQYFENPTLQSVGNALVGHRFQSIDKIAELLNHVDDPKQKQTIAHLALIDESWDEKGCLRLISKFVEFNQRLHDRRRIEEKIKAAEKNKDHNLLFKLLSEKQRLAIRTEKRKMDLLNEKKREVRNE